jgi:para-aminobenzoate synthetase component 1
MTRTASIPPPACWHLLESQTMRLPFWQYAALFRDRPFSFLLDSASDTARLGRYSFLGGDPFLVYQAWTQPGRAATGEARIRVTSLRPPSVTEYSAEVFGDLQRLLRQYAAPLRQRPVPFLAGAVGYVGYEAGRLIEELPAQAADDLGLPVVYLGFHDALLAHDHTAGRSYLSVLGRGNSERAARQNAERLRDEWQDRIAAFEADPPPMWTGPPTGQEVPPVPVRSAFDEVSYRQVVQAAREHILAGDAFEVCTTYRLESPFAGDPWELYQELRRINPAPFACYLRFPEVQVVCSSPERFLRLGADGIAEGRPIKGTRPRGRTPQEDEQLARALAESVKDRAENLMIVDLVRNDFGRVCKPRSIHVPELLAVERYATVFQLVSTIRGELAEGQTGLDLVRACFPPGSMTGAPKIEAMKIIDRLEPVGRGIYSGAAGYLDFAGPLDLNVVIRTVVVKDGRALYNVGGAVVADSDPHEEYQETQAKARALLDALANVRACHSHEDRPAR